MSYIEILQFIPQEEGSIRFKPASGSATASSQHDGLVKDHFGNACAVFTEEQQIDKCPVASLKGDCTTTNYCIFDNAKIIPNSSAPGLATYINDMALAINPLLQSLAANNQKLYRKTELSSTLKARVD